jgi:hypothetical protein
MKKKECCEYGTIVPFVELTSHISNVLSNFKYSHYFFVLVSRQGYEHFLKYTSGDGAVVEHSAHNQESKGSYLVAGTGREKTA